MASAKRQCPTAVGEHGERQPVVLVDMDGTIADFDGRVIRIPADAPMEAVNHQIWRSVLDCKRNCVSAFSRLKTTFSRIWSNPLTAYVFRWTHRDVKGVKKLFQGKNSKEMMRMMTGKGFSWEKDVPFFLKHGVYAKKTQYLKTCENPHTKKVCFVFFFSKWDVHFFLIFIDGRSREK